MMLLNSHVTCSCIFHAYVLFFPILSMCCVLLSLSLSLSRIDYVMAPKQCKSTPAQNPLQGSRSSVSNPLIPFHIWFHDKKPKMDFFENFQDRGVHSEHQVILSNFSKTTLPDVIRTRAWESLCEKPMRCPVVFIQEFYSNIHDIDTSVPQFATQFRRKCIVVTLDLVVGVLRVPKVVHPDYPTMIISELCLETNSSPFFMELLPYGVVS